MRKLKKFIQLSKYDETKGIGEGVLALEEVDSSGEKMDYATSKPFFEAWSADVYAKSRGKSKGNLRRQHDPQKAVGKLIDLDFDDALKQVLVRFKVTDPLTKVDCAEGVLTGLSIGGYYKDTWEDDDGIMNYTAQPVEASVVDRPAMPNATFVYKAEGGEETEREFSNVRQIEQIWTCGWDSCSKIHVQKRDAVACIGVVEEGEEMKKDATQVDEAPKPDDVEKEIAEAIAETPEPEETPVEETPEEEPVVEEETAEEEPVAETIDENPQESDEESVAEESVAEEENAPESGDSGEEEPKIAASEGEPEFTKAEERILAKVEARIDAQDKTIGGIEKAMVELLQLVKDAVEPKDKPRPFVQSGQRTTKASDSAPVSEERAKPDGEPTADDLVKASLSQPKPVFLSR